MPSSAKTYHPESVVKWQLRFGRQDLPWQNQSPYHTWVSEIMLQQTQVSKVINYFNRFISHFPDLKTLAAASEQQVLAQWSGLGYYNRAKNLHQTAQICLRQHHGNIPDQLQQLMALPGIGRSTAAAIRSLGHHQTAVIMDGNVKRIFARQFLISGNPNQSQTLKTFWQTAERHQHPKNPAAYTQGLMDLGATICRPKQPKCPICPIADSCQAKQQDRIAEFPWKKPKVKIKELQLHVLLTHQGQHLELIKRPHKGIWPDLWFFPTSEQKPKQNPLFTITHKLTHRSLKLHIYPQPSTKANIHRNQLPKHPHPKALIHILNHYDKQKKALPEKISSSAFGNKGS